MNFNELIDGVFIEESKNRFLCNVLINGVIEECYVPSSSRLENYLNLTNKKVLLTKNIGSNIRTKYSLFAVNYYNNYILLNLNKVNDLLSNYISKYEYSDSQLYNINKEEFINGYKTDLTIKGFTPGEERIIEAKGIIDIRRETYFPKVHSERALKQLNHIYTLLENNYKVEYYFVSLSPIVKRITIGNSTNDYYKLFKACLNKGLIVRGISVILNNKKEVSFKKTQIEVL